MALFITVEGITNIIDCALDVQLHEIQSQLKNKLNEQQAAIELLKKQHDRERVRCVFKIVLKVRKYSSISSDRNFILVYNNFLFGYLWIAMIIRKV